MIESDLADPRVVSYIIRRFGLRMKHKLGQNFLIRSDVVSEIAAAAELDADSHVLEIGPGIGTLTQGLARTGAQVTAVELDERLLDILDHTLSEYPNLHIIHQNICKMDLKGTLAGYEWHTAANLPYYITTPIMMALLEQELPITLFVFMMQKEVADRILAAPGGKEYGALTIGVRYHCTAERIMDVPPSAFIPHPAVTSTVLRLRKREKPAVDVLDEKAFFTMVKISFAQRRKVFLNSIKNGGIPPEMAQAILKETGIDGKRRAETFSLEEFAALTNAWVKLRNKA